MAGSTGFEPAVSSVTGWHVRPLHHEPAPTAKDSRYQWICAQPASRSVDSANAGQVTHNSQVMAGFPTVPGRKRFEFGEACR